MPPLFACERLDIVAEFSLRLIIVLDSVVGALFGLWALRLVLLAHLELEVLCFVGDRPGVQAKLPQPFRLLKP